MKKFVAIVLCFVLAVIVAGCGKVTYRIGVTIPSDSTDSFTWSDEEISPNGRKITIHSCDELGDAEIILKPVEVKEENAYDEPVMIARGKSVTLNAEKGAWFKIGIRMLDNAVPGKVKYFEIKDIEVRIASEPAPEDAVMFGKIKEIANDTLYIEAQNGNYFINNWMAYIPTGPTFEIGDEVAIRYSGTATETAPAGLCGVTAIDLTDEEYIRKYGDASAETEYPALILVQGVLYYDTSEISTSPRCGMLDGTISSVCDGIIPTEENQSNFGTGYGYQIGANRVEAFIDGKWHVFRPFVASEWESLPKEAETQPLTVPSAAEYPGVYQRTWREEIGGTVINLHSYIVLNEDHTGYWIAQDVGMLTWEDGQLTLTVGAVCDMALTREGETVNLLVFDSGEAPTVFEKIEELPEQIQSLLVRN